MEKRTKLSEDHERACDIRDGDETGMRVAVAICAAMIGFHTPPKPAERIGQMTLALAKATYDRLGWLVPIPAYWGDRESWHDYLDRLVLSILGDRRCIVCGHYWLAKNQTTAWIGNLETGVGYKTQRCLACGEIAWETVPSVVGVLV